MKAKDAIQLYWAISDCIGDFFKVNPDALPKEYYLLIEKANYAQKMDSGNPFVAKLIHKSEADISVLPCLEGLYLNDDIDPDTGEVTAYANLDKVSPIIDEWFRNNK